MFAVGFNKFWVDIMRQLMFFICTQSFHFGDGICDVLYLGGLLNVCIKDDIKSRLDLALEKATVLSIAILKICISDWNYKKLKMKM